MSATTIAASWERIEAWLGERAPEVLASLEGGASEEQLAEAERAVGVTFPDDLRESYRRHNGQRNDGTPLAFIGGVTLLDLAGIVSEWQIWKDLLIGGTFADARSAPDGPIRDDWWNARWIPLTWDGMGNNTCLDLDPPAGGDAGQIIAMWHDDAERTIIAPGFGAWLAGFADELEEGLWTTHPAYDGLVDTEDAEAEDAEG